MVVSGSHGRGQDRLLRTRASRFCAASERQTGQKGHALAVRQEAEPRARTTAVSCSQVRGIQTETR